MVRYGKWALAIYLAQAGAGIAVGVWQGLSMSGAI